MKIRILGNRIRLRLTQAEVASIGSHEEVKETTQIGDNIFGYSLSVHASDKDVDCRYADGEIRVSISKVVAKHWAESNEVGIETDNDQTPFIVIEKDFKCLTVRDGEDESDMFANPNTVC